MSEVRGWGEKRHLDDVLVVGGFAVFAALVATFMTFPFGGGLQQHGVEASSAWIARLPLGDTVSLIDGKNLFAQNCVTCHGEEGKRPIIGVPTLNTPRMLAIAADDYYATIITHGRPGSAMPAWQSIFTPNQIQSLVAYIRSWYPDEPDRSLVSAAKGNARYGAAFYHNNCAGCHGPNGEGGIGNSLRAPSFLAMASESFLRDTIIQGRGRGNTAMPTGYSYSPEELSDVLAFLNSWKEPSHSYSEVATLRSEATAHNAQIGASLFRANCAACHGRSGEGGIGSRLNSESFLSLVDDEFLYRSIIEGRPGTAMPSWHFLSAADVSDLISYLRTWQTGQEMLLVSREHHGDPAAGKNLYAMICRSCHGESGQGGVGGQLANSVFLSCASDDFLWQTIAHGKDGTAMRGFLRGTPGGALVDLRADEIDDVVAYLHVLETEQYIDPPKRPLTRRAELVGQMIYEGIGGCAKCHGLHGEGGTGPALRNPEFLHVASDGFLTGTIILGREHTPMLSFAGGGISDLSSDEIESVVSYIRSFEHKPFAGRKRVAGTPANIAAGKQLFLSNCASCHGSEGYGVSGNERVDGVAPSIHNDAFLAAANDGLILATIALGRPGTPMRPFARGAGGIADLSGDEILNILAFIRSWQGDTDSK